MVSYDRDFSLWLDLQVELLHVGKYTQLDIKNLIDELESMGKRDKRELASRLETLLMHMLKCIHCPNAITPSWIATIVEQRSRIKNLLDDSPSLSQLIPGRVADVYGNAVKRAAIEMGIAENELPASCPFPVTEILSTK